MEDSVFLAHRVDFSAEVVYQEKLSDKLLSYEKLWHRNILSDIGPSPRGARAQFTIKLRCTHREAVRHRAISSYQKAVLTAARPDAPQNLRAMQVVVISKFRYR